MAGRCWTLDAPDLSHLWEDCQRCFYLKVARGFPRPRATSSPAVLHTMLAAYGDGQRAEALAIDVPAGVLDVRERRVESEPLDVHLPDAVRHCRLEGSIGTVVRLDGGGCAIADLVAGDASLLLAARGLHATAAALEHPPSGGLELGPIRRLGVLAFEPGALRREPHGFAGPGRAFRWIEIPRDDGAFFGFLAEVLSVLEAPEPPGGAPLCQWCVYRDASRRTGL